MIKNSKSEEERKAMRFKLVIFSIIFLTIFSFSTTSAFNFETGGVKITEPTTSMGEVKVMTISKDHYEMHEGDHYFIKTWEFNDEGVNTFSYFSFCTPNTTTRIHAKAILFSDTDNTFEIFENATFTDGVPIAGQNNDRNSANIAELTAFATPNVSEEGDLMWAARNGGGRDPVGISLGLDYEIMARTDTCYLFKITKKSTADTVVDVNFFWYEEHG